MYRFIIIVPAYIATGASVSGRTPGTYRVLAYDTVSMEYSIWGEVEKVVPGLIVPDMVVRIANKKGKKVEKALTLDPALVYPHCYTHTHIYIYIYIYIY
ncbi:hypothetical protein KIPB_007421 [Kipferlia bialata]|uniref:Uncharacterized protein n=1 Tax=Kipferlia bialata TaxID=797122 RepID=A0A391NQ97_9EUKA|nr:hypothetical protein KIPB_007421 [Kipferlia bialata]|eukprot:g7421.t1